MSFPYCAGAKHANLKTMGREGCSGLHRAKLFALELESSHNLGASYSTATFSGARVKREPSAPIRSKERK